MMRRYRPPIRPPLIIREIGGKRIVGSQTRNLQMGDVVLIAEDGLESLQRIVRHQGDLIYLLSDLDGAHERWVHAKYVVAKIIWPKLDDPYIT